MPREAPSSHRAAPGGVAVTAISADARRVRALLGRSPHSRTMPGEFLDRLAALGRVERHPDGELMHSAWQPVRKLWLVLSGALRVTEVGTKGEALTTAVLGEGSYFAAGSLVKDGVRVKSDARAIGDTELAVFDLGRLEREFGRDPEVNQLRRTLLYLRFCALADLYRDALALPLPERLARRLLGQALAAGRDPEIVLHLTQADLAAMLGASRSRVNAELRRLEAAGAVRRGYRQIVVRNLELLKAAAGPDVVPL